MFVFCGNYSNVFFRFIYGDYVYFKVFLCLLWKKLLLGSYFCDFFVLLIDEGYFAF